MAQHYHRSMSWQKHIKKFLLLYLLLQVFVLNANFSDRVEEIRYHYAHGQIFSAFFKISELPDSNLTDMDILLKVNIFHDYSVFTRQYDIYLNYFDTLESDFILTNFDQLSSNYNEIYFNYKNIKKQAHMLTQKLQDYKLDKKQYITMIVTAYDSGGLKALNFLLEFVPVSIRVTDEMKICLAYCFTREKRFTKSAMLLKSIRIDSLGTNEIKKSQTSHLVSEIQTYNILHSNSFIDKKLEYYHDPVSGILLNFKDITFTDSVLTIIENIEPSSTKDLLLAYYYYHTGEPILAHEYVNKIEPTEFKRELQKRIVLAGAERIKSKLDAETQRNDSLNIELPEFPENKPETAFHFGNSELNDHDRISPRNLRDAITVLNSDEDIFSNTEVFMERLFLDRNTQYEYENLKNEIQYRLKTGDYDKILSLTEEFSDKFAIDTDSIFIYKYTALRGLNNYDEALTALSELATSTDNDSIRKRIVLLLPEIIKKVSLENGADNMEQMINKPEMIQYKGELFCNLAKHYENYQLFDMANRIYKLCLADSICKMDRTMLNNLTDNLLKLKKYDTALFYFDSFSDSIQFSQRMKYNVFTAYYETGQQDSAFSTMIQILSETSPDSLENEVILSAASFFADRGNLNLSLLMYEIYLSHKFNVLNKEQNSAYVRVKQESNINFQNEIKINPLNIILKKEIERIKK